MKLQLEARASLADPSEGSRVMVTPPITEDYWLARVQVGGGQALVAFPKFGTIGIGFAQEEDWNTNLPYTSPAAGIWNHIKHNRGAATATEAECLQAISMLSLWAQAYRRRQ